MATTLGTWDAFKVKLLSSFENKNKRKDAAAKLGALRQGSQTAEEFFQQFELTRHEADLTDNVDNVLIDILEREGTIDREVLKQIYASGTDIPTTYTAYRDLVIRVDAQNRRYKSISENRGNTPRWQTPATPLHPLPTPPRYSGQQQNTPATAPAWRLGLGTTYGGLGKPMDLDKARSLRVC